MTTKLKGSRLEAEVDRARTEGNWKRLAELLPSIKSKSSGMEESYDLLDAEIRLETFLEQLGEPHRPNPDHFAALQSVDNQLKETLREKHSSPVNKLEAHLLLAKLHYSVAQYDNALKDVDNSGMDLSSTQFRTLRSFRLVAEAYAIKGLCLEHQEESKENPGAPSQKVLFCFEKSADLAILYVAELEKTLNSTSSKGQVPLIGMVGFKQEKLGEILESCLERVAKMRVKDRTHDNIPDADGIEWYRKIISHLGDKSTGERLQQKLARQLAELLIRTVAPERIAASQAVNAKTQNLSFYGGSQKSYFSPTSRQEEIILLLMISEVLATREVVLSRNEELSASRAQSLRNAKSVYNLLTLVLSTLRQYHVLCNIFERSMKFANQDVYLWEQFGLSLLCRGKWLRAARVIDSAAAIDGANTTMLHLLSAQLHIQHLRSFDTALTHAHTALQAAADSNEKYLVPRCQLLAALATGLQAQCEPLWENQRKGLNKAVVVLEECVRIDAHDYLALYYCALFHAIVRDLESARERCARSLELNPDQPAAYMLMALIFTADGDLKGAMELVQTALRDFPNNYGLLVLRLHIEAKFGRVEDSLNTCAHLLEFWRKREGTLDEERAQMTLSAKEGQSMLREGSQKAISVGARDMVTASTPLFPTPLGIGINTAVLGSNTSQTALDVAESGVTPSENGAPSTASETVLAGSPLSAAMWTKFIAQADMWLALSELFLAEGRQNEVTPCVEQAVSLFPQSQQAMYLKGRLLFSRAKAKTDGQISLRLLQEAKTAFLSALTLCPLHTPSLSSLAELYIQEENHQMAEHLYKMDKPDKQFIDLGDFNADAVDCMKMPATAEEYLKQVVAGRSRIPDYVVYTLPDKYKTRPAAASSVQSKDPRAASSEWIEAKCKDFGRKRQAVQEAPQRNQKFRLPNNNTGAEWYSILFETCIPELKDEAVRFPNHIGTPPSLALIQFLPQAKVQFLTECIADWAETDGFSRPLREWLYALMLVVDVPLLHDVVAALRSVAKHCRSIRAALAVDDVESTAEMSLFIAIISNYFGQRDLSD